MTAIGFVAATLGLIVAGIAESSYSHQAKAIQAIGATFVICGSVAVFTGIAIKLWEIMP